MLFFRLAYRNLWRNKRRTRLTLMAMTIATALVIFMLGMYDGMLWDMISNATEMIQGHVTVAAAGFIDNPRVHLHLDETAAVRKSLAGLAEVRGVCGRVVSFGLLSCGAEERSKTQPAELIGADPDEERGISRLAQSVASGAFLDRAEGKGILLGKGLARKLDAVLGAEIVFMGQGADGSIAAEIFHLTGIIETGDSMRDARLAVIGRRTLQNALGIPGRVHQWNIFLRRPLAAEALATAWRGEFAGLDVRPWQSFIPQIAMLVRIWLAVQIFTMAIFYSAILLIGFNTMYMAYRERVREFAIMSALGLNKLRLAWLIILEGGMLSGLSGLLGAVFGILLSGLFHLFPLEFPLPDVSYGGTSIRPRIFCVLTVMNIGLPAVCMMAVGLVVALFPAWKVFRQRPVEALREG